MEVAGCGTPPLYWLNRHLELETHDGHQMLGFRSEGWNPEHERNKHGGEKYEGLGVLEHDE
jgi:hypothetical protein